MKSLDLRDITVGGFDVDSEGISHDKVVPCFTVVQACRGSYDIGLDDGEVVNTGEGGVFITPPGALQHITHHNGDNGRMKAQWVFFNAVVDSEYPLQYKRRFPLLLPSEYTVAAGKLLRQIRKSESLCARQSALYALLDILLACSERADTPEPMAQQIHALLTERLSERLTAADMAEALHISQAQVFRFTKKYFGKTPAHYLNYLRLQRAAFLLSSSDRSVKEIALDCGFYDTAYFSRLFRELFRISPRAYRQKEYPR